MAKRSSENEANTKEIILNAAYILLAKKGYANVSTRDIAQAAGVALSQLSYYYKTKDKLLLDIIRLSTDKIVVEIKSLLSKEKTNRQNYEALVIYFKNLVVSDPELFRLVSDFMAQAIWKKEIRLNIYQFFREMNIIVQNFILKEEENQKTYNNLPIEYVAELVIYGLFGITLHTLFGDTGSKYFDDALTASVIFEKDKNI